MVKGLLQKYEMCITSAQETESHLSNFVLKRPSNIHFKNVHKFIFLHMY